MDLLPYLLLQALLAFLAIGDARKGSMWARTPTAAGAGATAGTSAGCFVSLLGVLGALSVTQYLKDLCPWAAAPTQRQGGARNGTCSKSSSALQRSGTPCSPTRQPATPNSPCRCLVVEYAAANRQHGSSGAKQRARLQQPPAPRCAGPSSMLSLAPCRASNPVPVPARRPLSVAARRYPEETKQPTTHSAVPMHGSGGAAQHSSKVVPYSPAQAKHSPMSSRSPGYMRSTASSRARTISTSTQRPASSTGPSTPSLMGERKHTRPPKVGNPLLNTGDGASTASGSTAQARPELLALRARFGKVMQGRQPGLKALPAGTGSMHDQACDQVCDQVAAMQGAPAAVIKEQEDQSTLVEVELLVKRLIAARRDAARELNTLKAEVAVLERDKAAALEAAEHERRMADSMACQWKACSDELDMANKKRLQDQSTLVEVELLVKRLIASRCDYARELNTLKAEVVVLERDKAAALEAAERERRTADSVACQWKACSDELDMANKKRLQDLGALARVVAELELLVESLIAARRDDARELAALKAEVAALERDKTAALHDDAMKLAALERDKAAALEAADREQRTADRFARQLEACSDELDAANRELRRLQAETKRVKRDCKAAKKELEAAHEALEGAHEELEKVYDSAHKLQVHCYYQEQYLERYIVSPCTCRSTTRCQHCITAARRQDELEELYDVDLIDLSCNRSSSSTSTSTSPTSTPRCTSTEGSSSRSSLSGWSSDTSNPSRLQSHPAVPRLDMHGAKARQQLEDDL